MSENLNEIRFRLKSLRIQQGAFSARACTAHRAFKIDPPTL